MSLKFKCQNCGKEITVKFLKVGEIAECKSCGSANAVPETAVEIPEDPGYSKCGGASKERYAKTNFAKASLVMGILSLFAGIVTAIPAIIFGLMGPSKYRNEKERKFRSAGLILGLFTISWIMVLSVATRSLITILILPVPSIISNWRTHGLLYTQHGCPFKCTFCQSSVFEKQRFTVNFESIKRVLDYYRKTGINYIGTMDETFGSDPEFTDQVTRLLAHHKFYWWAQTRVEIIQRHLDEWYERGLRMPAIGVECMSQSTLSAVNKGQRIADIIDYAHRSSEKPGMFRTIYYMIGFEDMTVEETLEDAERVSKLGFDMSTVGIITPYPKTPFWDTVNAKYGIFDHNYRHYDNEHLVWNHPRISPTEMMQLREKVLNIINRPTIIYLKKFIRGLRRKNAGFLWRYLVKGPIVSRLIDDRRQVFLPKLSDTSG